MQRFDRAALLRRGVVAEVDRELGRRGPPREQPLGVPRHQQQRAEHDHRQRDGDDGERAGAAAAPQARPALPQRIVERPHATSTTLP